MTGRSLKGKPSNEPRKNSKPRKQTRPEARDLSDAELKARVERLQLEKRYNELNPKQVSAGKQVVNAVGKKVITPVLIDTGKKVLNKKLSEALGVSEQNEKKKKD